MAEFVRKPFAPVNNEARLNNVYPNKRIEKVKKIRIDPVQIEAVTVEPMCVDAPTEPVFVSAHEPSTPVSRTSRASYMSPSDDLLSPCTKLLIKEKKRKPVVKPRALNM